MSNFKSSIFQGSFLEIEELGPYLTDIIKCSFKPIDYSQLEMEVDGEESQVGEVEGQEEECHEVNLFSSVTLPQAVPSVSRDLSWRVAIQTEGHSWEGLRNALAKNQSEVVSKNGKDCKKVGLPAPLEIYAVSWPSSSGGNKDHNGNESEVDDTVLKVSHLLNECLDDATKEDYVLQLVVINSHSYHEGQNFALVELDEDEENLAEQFEFLCDTIKSLTVHWLRTSNFGFMWRKTKGFTMNRITSKCHPIVYSEESWLRYLNEDRPNNMICISGVAGSGKSVLLKRIAHAIKNRYKNRLICFIDLNMFSSRMKGVEEVITSKSMEYNVFRRLICEYFGIESDLEQKLLHDMLSRQKSSESPLPKLEILLDGLDQMSRGMRTVLLNFLKTRLSPPDSWGFRVWITTSPYLKRKVEDTFSLVAFDLNNLEPVDIRTYLLLCKSDSAGDIDEIFSSRLKSHLKLDLGGLLSLPSNMTRFQSFRQRLKERQRHLYDLNGMEILEDLIKNLKANYKRKKLRFNNFKEKHLRVILSHHVALACQTFLKKVHEAAKIKTDLIYELGDYESANDFLRRGSSKVEQSLSKFGIVINDEDNFGELKFLQEAFASYVLVEHYMEYDEPTEEDFLDSFFFHYVLYKDECEQVRLFYNQRLYHGMNINKSESWSEELHKFLVETYDLDCDNYQPPSEYGNLLQLMIIDQKLAIAKQILRSFHLSRGRQLRRLIERKVMVELELGSLAKQYLELSALSLAIMFGDIELLHLMYVCLDNESDEGDAFMTDFNYQDTCRFTQAHLAVIACNLDTLEYLGVHRKVSISTLDAWGHVPLHLVFYNRWDLTFYVEEPSLNSSRSQIQLPSSPSPKRICREIKIQKYYNDLIASDSTQPDEGASDTATTDRVGQLPILASKLGAENGHREFLQMQMKKNVNFPHQPVDKPSEAVYYNSIANYLSIVEKLTGRTSNIEGISLLIEPPFHLACAEGHLPIVESMVGKGADINIKDGKGCTALLAAILKGHLHIVKYLLGRGIDRRDLKIVIDNRFPLLHHICSLNLAKMVEYFVKDLGHSVDLKTNEDETPLHIACFSEQCCSEVVKVLLDMGAQVNAKDKYMLTPLLQACSVQYDKDSSIPPRNYEPIKLLIDKGADVNAQNKIGESALHFAVASGDQHLVKYLLTCCEGIEEDKQKLNLNIKTTTSPFGEGRIRPGSTPLHYACRTRGNLDILASLVKSGANVNAMDNLNQTPLLILVSAKTEDIDEEMCRFLVGSGAGMTQSSKLGNTAYRELGPKNMTFAKELLSLEHELEFPKENHKNLPNGLS